MAIYSRLGCLVQITHCLGKQKVEGFSLPVVVVRAIRKDPGKPDDPWDVKCYVAFNGLRADDGMNEIERAVDAAPLLKLSGKELKAAIIDAA